MLLRNVLPMGAFALVVAGCNHGASPNVSPTPTTAQQADSAAQAAIKSEQSIDVATLPAKTIAVPPLAVDVKDTTLAPLGYGIADLLATDLARSPQLTVVERLRLDAVLRETKLVSSGAVDTTTAPRLGKLTGARRLVVGVMVGDSAGLDGNVQIDAKLADVATGEVKQVVSARAPVSHILDAEVELALRTYEALGIVLTPAEKDAIQQQATKNLAALLAYSRGVRDEAMGQYDQAATEYRNAITADPAFNAAKANLGNVQQMTPSVQSAGVTPATKNVAPPSGGSGLGGGVGDVSNTLNGTVNASPADASGGGVKSAGSTSSSGSTPTQPPPEPVQVKVVIPITRAP